MYVIGFGGISEDLSPEQEAALLEALALKMKALLEEHGWKDSFGRDPVLILIEAEDEELNDDERIDDK